MQCFYLFCIAEKILIELRDIHIKPMLGEFSLSEVCFQVVPHLEDAAPLEVAEDIADQIVYVTTRPRSWMCDPKVSRSPKVSKGSMLEKKNWNLYEFVSRLPHDLWPVVLERSGFVGGCIAACCCVGV